MRTERSASVGLGHLQKQSELVLRKRSALAPPDCSLQVLDVREPDQGCRNTRRREREPQSELQNARHAELGRGALESTRSADVGVIVGSRNQRLRWQPGHRVALRHRTQRAGCVNADGDYADAAICSQGYETLEVLLSASGACADATWVENVEVRLGGLVERAGGEAFQRLCGAHGREADVAYQAFLDHAPKPFRDLLQGRAHGHARVGRIGSLEPYRFFFLCYGDLRDLHSLPTRRSSARRASATAGLPGNLAATA